MTENYKKDQTLFNELEQKARIKLTPEQKELFSKDLESFKKALLSFDKIDLTNVSEASRPFEVFSNYLRSDDENHRENKINVIKNSNNFENDLFIFKKG